MLLIKIKNDLICKELSSNNGTIVWVNYEKKSELKSKSNKCNSFVNQIQYSQTIAINKGILFFNTWSCSLGWDSGKGINYQWEIIKNSILVIMNSFGVD